MRRTLEFASLTDVMPEVERLLAGHVTVGAWSLGQICHHLATAIRLTVDAPIRRREATREQDVARRLFFRSGEFPEGMEAPIRPSCRRPSVMPPPRPMPCVWRSTDSLRPTGHSLPTPVSVP